MKKIISLLLSVLMMATLIPTMALTAVAESSATPVIEVFNDGEGKTTFASLIGTTLTANTTYKLMEDTRKGQYARSGLPAAERKLMRACGFEEWFLESLCKIGYLFPKAFGVSRVEIAGKLMWYKLHFPKDFLAVMSN